MPYTPSRRRLQEDWAKAAEETANGKGPGNLQELIGEYLRNTKGLRELMLAKEKYDTIYAHWCEKQAGQVAARQNHTNAGVLDIRKQAQKILTEDELCREYDEDRADKLNQRLEKIENMLAKVTPLNIATMIENEWRGFMEKMIDQLTDRVVKRFEGPAEKECKKEEIRRGKQVEATPEEEGISEVEFEPGATFSCEENVKVHRILKIIEVEEQELDQSKHAPKIRPGGVGEDFPCREVEQVRILKPQPVVPAVPQQKKKERKIPEAKDVPKGPKAGEKKQEVKKPESKKPEGMKPEEKNTRDVRAKGSKPTASKETT
jgi:hypothetical protein